jgi:hypothetical protein
MLRRVPEHEAPKPAVEPAAPVAAPVAAPALGAAPALMRSLQARVGNAIVARAIAARDIVDDLAPPDAVPLDDTQPTGGGSAAGPKPTFDHSGGTTVTINADSAVEFSQKITATIGSPHTSPTFTPDIQVDFKTDGAGKEVPGTRTIASIGLDVKTAITKVRFGMGRVDADNKAVIDQMVKEIQAHEERHRAIVETAATAALTAAQKLVGTKKEKEAKTALTKTLECATNKQHEALDATEGLLTVSEVRQPDGSIKLQLSKSASGAKYPC